MINAKLQLEKIAAYKKSWVPPKPYVATQEDINTIIAAQEHQLVKPARAVVNCEGSFVKDTIKKTNYELSQVYWLFCCSFDNKDKPYNLKFGKQVFDNQVALRDIDKTVTMPSWGYAGT